MPLATNCCQKDVPESGIVVAPEQRLAAADQRVVERRADDQRRQQQDAKPRHLPRICPRSASRITKPISSGGKSSRPPS